MVIGGHGDTTMIPLTRLSSKCGVPASHFLSADELASVKGSTMVGGATLTGLLGTSAWYAPGAAVSTVVQSIVCDQHKMIPSCVMLDGEYGLSDICIGVPTILGANGVEEIIELDLNAEEKEAMMASAEKVRAVNALLN
jgi:malate dehydrogenase